MKRLLVMLLSMSLVLGNVGSMTALAAEPAEIVAADIAESSKDTENVLQGTDEITEVDEVTTPDVLEGDTASLDEEAADEILPEDGKDITEETGENKSLDVLEDEVLSDEDALEEQEDDLTAEEPVDEALSEDAEGKPAGEKDAEPSEASSKLMDAATAYISGSIDAKDLKKNTIYTLTGSTTITLAEGDDVEVEKIVTGGSVSLYPLTIEGSNSGKLRINEGIASYNTTINIKGGAVSAGYISASLGSLNISGGSLYVNYITELMGAIDVSDGYVVVYGKELGENSNSTINTGSYRQSGGYLETYCESGAPIFASDDIEITGGVLKAVTDEGLNAICGDSISISGDMQIEASAKKSAIMTTYEHGLVIEGLITSPAGAMISDNGEEIVDSEGKSCPSVRIESARYTYGISTDNSDGIDFETTTMGAPAPDAVTVTVTNTGNGSIVLLDINPDDYEAYRIGDYSSKQLKENETATFTIQPKEYLRNGNYEKKFVITTNRPDITATIPLKYTVEKSDYDIILEEEGKADFGMQKEGYGELEPKTFTIVNVGNEAVTLSQPESASFILDGVSGTLSVGDKKTFTIVPKTGLDVDNYQEEIIIRTTEGAFAKLSATFSVEAWDYSFEYVDGPDLTLNFGAASVGYTSLPQAKKITVINTGDCPDLKLVEPDTYRADDYNISYEPSNGVFAPGKSVTITIQPKENLDAGYHDAWIYLTTEQGSTIQDEITMYFTVNSSLSGEYNASELNENVDYILEGDTTIIVDADRTIGDIRGTEGKKYSLTITGKNDKTLKPYRIENDGNLTIKSGNIQAEEVVLNAGDITVEGGSLSTYSEIFTAGNVTITGGIVSPGMTTSQEASLQCVGTLTMTGGSVNCDGIYGCVYSLGAMSITGGSVVVRTSDAYRMFQPITGLRSDLDINISGDAYVDSYGGAYGYSVYADGKINIGEGLVISNPVAGTVGTYDGHSFIVDSEGNRADTAMIQRGSYSFTADILSCSFGKIPVGYAEPIEDKEIVFTNTGSCTDVIQSVTLTDAHFIIANAETLSGVQVESGEAVTVKVALAPGVGEVAGKYEGNLELSTKTGRVYSIPVQLEAIDAGDAIWVDEIPDYTYTGTKITPVTNVYYLGKKLSGSDYTISYKNNKDAADKTAKRAPSVTISLKGNYSGKATRYFTIKPVDLACALAEDVTLVYNNARQKAKTKVTCVVNGSTWTLKENKDYVIDYQIPAGDKTRCKEPGSYKIIARGKGNFTGDTSFTMTIVTEDITLMSKAKVSAIPTQNYCGKEIILSGNATYKQQRAVDSKGKEVELVVKNAKGKVMEPGRDYNIKGYSDNVQIGTATVILSGSGAYAGEKAVTFKIVGKAMSAVKFEDGTFAPTKPYTGSEITQNPKLYCTKKEGGKTVKDKDLVEGTDYTVSYQNNTKVGTATVIYTGMNEFSGTLKKTFKITTDDFSKLEASDFSVTLFDKLDESETAKTSFAYTKGGVKPGIKVVYKGKRLTEGVDYTVKFTNNNDTSSALAAKNRKPAAKVQGKGNFKGTKEVNYEITDGLLNKDSILFIAKDVPINDKKAGLYKTTVTITDLATNTKLKAGTDYDKTFKYTYAETGVEVNPKDIITTPTTINVTVTGKGCYAGKGEKPQTYVGSFKFFDAATEDNVPNDISKLKISVAPQIYTGEAVEISGKDITFSFGNTELKLTEGVDYEFVPGTWEKNINKGTARVMIRGLGTKGGTKTISFRIRAKEYPKQ